MTIREAQRQLDAAHARNAQRAQEEQAAKRKKLSVEAELQSNAAERAALLDTIAQLESAIRKRRKENQFKEQLSQ